MNEGEFLRVNLCCTQQKLERVLNREDAGFALRRVELKGEDTYKWVEIDWKIGWGAQSQAEIGILRRNASECRDEGESDTCIIRIWWSNL